MGGFKNIKIKERKNISILRDIPLFIVNKYWTTIDESFLEDIHIDYKIYDSNGLYIAKVIKILKEKKSALLEMPTKVNYFDLVKLGVGMDKIVFDLDQVYIGVFDKKIKHQYKKKMN